MKDGTGKKFFKPAFTLNGPIRSSILLELANHSTFLTFWLPDPMRSIP